VALTTLDSVQSVAEAERSGQSYFGHAPCERRYALVCCLSERCLRPTPFARKEMQSWVYTCSSHRRIVLLKKFLGGSPSGLSLCGDRGRSFVATVSAEAVSKAKLNAQNLRSKCVNENL